MAEIEIRLKRRTPRYYKYVSCATPVYYVAPVRYIRVPEIIEEVETVQHVQPVTEVTPKTIIRRWNEIVPREEVRRWNEVVPREEVIRTVEVRHGTRVSPPVTTVRTYEAAETIYERL